jgi:polyphosphate kinase 2 (PPK2 family)
VAYADALRETSTDAAPWYCIPGNHKWYRNWAVLRILIETLEDMDPQWPAEVEGVEGTVVT